MVEKKAYNCILSQVLSPCGDVLVCGNIYGDISIFELGSVLDDGGHVLHKAAKRIFSSPNREQVNSLASTAQFLIAGTCGAIFGWDWESVKNYKPELKWTIILPSARERLLETDVNTLLVTPGNIRQELYAGCGDNIIYAFNLEDGQLIRTLEGHSDYIHSLSTENRQMASASEDGTVRLWDMRQASITSKIEPHSEPKLARNNFGKWIGDVSITNDWMVCGGGPRCSLWHMRTMQMMTSFTEFSDFEVHISRIKGDSILCGGASSHFYQASFTGQLQSKMTTSAITLYTAVYSEVPRDVLTLAGSGNAVDVCTNFTYRHKVLNFYD